MNLLPQKLVILSLLACNLTGASTGYALPVIKGGLKYCLPTKVITSSPFDSLDDPTKLFYLFILTKSYISTNKNEPGVLSKWQFSPDGLRFSGVVAPGAEWSSGRNVSSKEAALGIAKGMLTKPIGGALKVLGFDALLKDDWQSATLPGVIIKSATEFELIFQSQVKNPAGVLREALSTSSRSNRMWPVRLEKGNTQKTNLIVPDFVSKFPLKILTDKIAVIEVDGTEISLVSGECEGGDFYGYGVPNQQDVGFTSSQSSGEQTILAVFNSQKPNLRDKVSRNKLGEWLRGIFENKRNDGVRASPAHFLEGEPGFQQNKIWGHFKSILVGVPSLNIMLGTAWPANASIRTRILEKASSEQVQLTWKSWEGKEDSNFDVKLAGSRVQKGRQSWTQEMLNDDYYAQSIRNYPRTLKALQKAKELSAATVPVDNETLKELEEASKDEVSIVPVARYSVSVFSRIESPLELVFTTEDEQTFRRRKK